MSGCFSVSMSLYELLLTLVLTLNTVLAVWVLSRFVPCCRLENMMDKLGPLLTEDPIRQVALVAQTVVRLLGENLPALQGQNLTLENMFVRVPILQEVFSALGVEGDVLDAMLKSPVESIQMMVEALLTNGTTAMESVCNMTKLQEMLKLPASFNSTALYTAVCLKNNTSAVDNLVRNLDLQGLLDSLQSPVATANWTQVLQQSQELQQSFQELLNNPPTFNDTTLMAMLESSFNTSNLWQMNSMANYYQMYGLLQAFPGLQGLDTVMKSASAVLELLDDMVNRLVLDGATLDLATLFSSSPSFVRLMDAALHAQPNPITALALVQLNPAKVRGRFGSESS